MLQHGRTNGGFCVLLTLLRPPQPRVVRWDGWDGDRVNHESLSLKFIIEEKHNERNRDEEREREESLYIYIYRERVSILIDYKVPGLCLFTALNPSVEG